MDLVDENLEFWLSGPIPNIPASLQPAAHALLQSERELKNILQISQKSFCGLRLLVELQWVFT